MRQQTVPQKGWLASRFFWLRRTWNCRCQSTCSCIGRGWLCRIRCVWRRNLSERYLGGRYLVRDAPRSVGNEGPKKSKECKSQCELGEHWVVTGKTPKIRLPKEKRGESWDEWNWTRKICHEAILKSFECLGWPKKCFCIVEWRNRMESCSDENRVGVTGGGRENRGECGGNRLEQEFTL